MAFGPNTPLVQATDVVSLLPGLTAADSAINFIIAGVSDLARRECGLAFLAQGFSDQYKGKNGQRIVLRNQPVLLITLLALAGMAPGLPLGYGVSAGNLIVQPVGTDPNGLPIVGSFGYWNDKEAVNVGGYYFPYSNTPNVFVNYVAGYVSAPVTTTSASFTMPAVGATSPSLQVGSSAGLTGSVFFAGAGLLTSAIVDSTHITLTNPGGNATVAPNTVISSGASISVTTPQTSLPADLYEALAYECAAQYKELDRIGMTSMNLGGESVTTYKVTWAMPRTARVLADYKRTWFGYY